MKNKYKIAIKIIIAIGFGLLFVHRVQEMQIAYIKFALIDFIYENNLQFLFYVFSALELFIAVSIFFNKSKIIGILLDLAFAAYLIFGISYFLILQSTTDCIECNYTTHFFNENLKITMAIIIGLFLIYAVVIRKVNYRINLNNSLLKSYY